MRRPFRARHNTSLHDAALLPSVAAMADAPPSASQAFAAGHRARLRQRLFDGGAKALLDHELVEYLLALAIPRRDTKPIAKALLKQFGTIAEVLAAPAARLKEIDVIGDAVVVELKLSGLSPSGSRATPSASGRC